ncbi:Cystatin-F [Galemys pyrenaicus]|uniref:Cystatin-F n=1 Tax=Galemys pyrenaicus TaxID=202257 RepID=A0A8J6ATW7_GALPY|nr:Cystatin-F [Galemys pyrenaicus]
MPRAKVLLAFCCLILNTLGTPSTDFCSYIFHTGVKPGFPKTINTNNPEVRKVARLSVERFNNCTDDIFLYKESHIHRALVQIVKGLKYMLDVQIARTTCKKNKHPSLDNCDFQTNHTLKRVNNGKVLPSHPHPTLQDFEKHPLHRFSNCWLQCVLLCFRLSAVTLKSGSSPGSRSLRCQFSTVSDSLLSARLQLRPAMDTCALSCPQTWLLLGLQK